MRAVIIWLVAIFTGLAPAVPAHAAGSITKIEARKLPGKIVTRRVLDQLSDVLELEPYPARKVPPHRPLTDLWFWTLPRATSLRGLCSSDEVTVYFKAVSGPEKDAHSAMTAAGIASRTSYHFLATHPSLPAQEASAAEKTKADKQCSELAPSGRNSFLQATNLWRPPVISCC